SHIGRTSIFVPEGTSIEIEKNIASRPGYQRAYIEGPKGKVSMELPGFVGVEKQGADRISVSVEDSSIKKQRQMWGTARAILANHIQGVTEDHIAVLKFVGTGYRALLKDSDRTVVVKVGFADDVEVAVPEDLSVTLPQPTRLVIKGVDLQKVTQFAARIRAIKKPEPYKGKGIFVNDETIKLKQRKVK
ncbi:hypothetical protein CANCADRAFT_16593, partial [Tortispora caseinolytica NRRL Y-17796]